MDAAAWARITELEIRSEEDARKIADLERRVAALEQQQHQLWGRQ